MGKLMGKKKLSVKAANAIRDHGMHLDGDVPGLYLKVAPGGSKSWILRTLIHGKRRDIGLGGFPTTTLAEAREEARNLRAIARKGGNPLEGRRKAKSMTFTEAAEIVHREQILPTAKNAKHQAQWINTIQRYADPVIGKMPVDTISSADILQVLSKVWVEKPETGRRLKQRLQTVFAWTRQAGHREASNPVENVSTALPRQREKPKHFAAMPWQELPVFYDSLDSQSGVSSRALAFLILNAARTGEVIGARWEEIDFDNFVWTIPAERMKTKSEHRKPLADAALDVLNQVRTLDPVFIFPGNKPNQPLSNMAMLNLMKRMERNDFTVHGFRTSFRVWAAEQTDTPREIAEMCLAHDVRGAVEQAYARTDYFAKRSNLMRRWSNWCTGIG